MQQVVLSPFNHPLPTLSPEGRGTITATAFACLCLYPLIKGEDISLCINSGGNIFLSLCLFIRSVAYCCFYVYSTTSRCRGRVCMHISMGKMGIYCPLLEKSVRHLRKVECVINLLPYGCHFSSCPGLVRDRSGIFQKDYGQAAMPHSSRFCNYVKKRWMHYATEFIRKKTPPLLSPLPPGARMV
jgi:hypothetical protein